MSRSKNLLLLVLEILQNYYVVKLSHLIGGELPNAFDIFEIGLVIGVQF